MSGDVSRVDDAAWGDGVEPHAAGRQERRREGFRCVHRRGAGVRPSASLAAPPRETRAGDGGRRQRDLREGWERGGAGRAAIDAGRAGTDASRARADLRDGESRRREDNDRRRTRARRAAAYDDRDAVGTGHRQRRVRDRRVLLRGSEAARALPEVRSAIDRRRSEGDRGADAVGTAVPGRWRSERGAGRPESPEVVHSKIADGVAGIAPIEPKVATGVGPRHGLVPRPGNVSGVSNPLRPVNTGSGGVARPAHPGPGRPVEHPQIVEIPPVRSPQNRRLRRARTWRPGRSTKQARSAPRGRSGGCQPPSSHTTRPGRRLWTRSPRSNSNRRTSTGR